MYNIVIRPIEYLIEVIYVIMERFLGHPGYAVIAVSLTVSFLCLPLYLRAEELQRNESEKQKKLKKWTDHINRHFNGEEGLFVRTCIYRFWEHCIEGICSRRGCRIRSVSVPALWACSCPCIAIQDIS